MTRSTGKWVFVSGVVLLLVWVLLPIYLLMVNALSAPNEVTGFPNARFDDQVDALSQLFIWLRDRYKFDDCEMLCGPKWGAQLQG